MSDLKRNNTAMEKMLLLQIINQENVSFLAHIIHLILTLMTMGVWSPLWVLHVASSDVRKNRIRKDNDMKDKPSIACALFALFLFIFVCGIFAQA